MNKRDEHELDLIEKFERKLPSGWYIAISALSGALIWALIAIGFFELLQALGWV